MSFGDGNLHERVERLENANGRLCEEVNALEARNRELEELIGDMRREMRPVESDVFLLGWIDGRIADLRIEVDE